MGGRINTQLLILKGLVSELSTEEQELIKGCKARIEDLIKEYPENVAMIAISLIGLEITE